MKSNVKLLALTLVTGALVTACNGSGLPTGTGTGAPGQPGFTVRITKNGAAAANRTVFLKKFNGVSEGSYGNSSHVASATAKTDSTGTVFLPAPSDAVSGGALFGVGYDATAADSGNNPQAIDATKNPDEIQYFTTPAVNLSTKTGTSASINFDLGWSAAGFTPASGSTVQGSKVTFNLSSYSGATGYEVDVNTGSVLGSGTKAFSQTSTGTQLIWDGASNGTYVYQAKATTASGIVGINSNTVGSAWSIFTVAGAQ